MTKARNGRNRYRTPRYKSGGLLPGALVVLIVAVLAFGVVVAVRSATGGSDTASRTSDTVAVSALPAQARETLALIREGGPFPYPRNDGVVFDNREGLLPSEPHGWYHEYTVPTPGSSDRGARRIVVGHDGTRYYTDDHYRSFRRIEGDSP